MKLKLIAAAVASLAAGNALALDITQTATVTLHLAGSSAFQKTIESIIHNSVCDPTTDTVYQDPGSAGNGKHEVAHFCTTQSASTALGIGTATNLLVYYRVDGGSIFGVDYPGQVNAHFYHLGADCGTLTAGTAVCTAWNNGPVASLGSADYTSAIPDIGLSDVEPAMFTKTTSAINVPATCADTYFAETPCPSGTFNSAAATSTPVAVQVMGIAVSSALYAALQLAEGTTGQPSLTTAQIASMMAKSNLSTNAATKGWDNLRAVLNTEYGTTDTTLSGPVLVCRRTAGSGTQATWNGIAMGNPCALKTASNLTILAKGNSVTGYSVQENSGSGDVINCLTTSTALPLAMGILSTDQAGNLSSGAQYIKIDGFDIQNAANVENGLIKTAIESTMQMSVALDTPTAGTSAASDIAKGLRQLIIDGNPGTGFFNVKGSAGPNPLNVTRSGKTCAQFTY